LLSREDDLHHGGAHHCSAAAYGTKGKLRHNFEGLRIISDIFAIDRRKLRFFQHKLFLMAVHGKAVFEAQTVDF
jgi:hypothetical protein